MRSLIPLTVYCVSLLSLQQILAVPLGGRLERNRMDLLKKLHDLREEDESTSLEAESVQTGAHASPLPVVHSSEGQLPASLGDTPTSDDIRSALRNHALAWPRGSGALRRGGVSRGRRHAHQGGRGGHHRNGHAQLMRVGCFLGTCQVQNLSHRLYQLTGQSGREDSSPINPRSPHSYG